MISLLVQFIGNGAGIYAATTFIDGFSASLEPYDLAIAAGVLTLINLIAKPILKLVLSPIIILTFGLAIIGINMFTLYALDYLLPTITITGLEALLWATILTTVINVTARAIK